MCGMIINPIDLGEGLKAFEFLLNPQDRIKSGAAERKDSRPELEMLANLYYNERLVTIDRVKYPFVYIAESELDRIILAKADSPYVLPERFSKFAEGVIEQRKKKNQNPTDGSCMSIKGWHKDSNGLILNVKQLGYFNFIATNGSMDIPFKDLDPSFNYEEGKRTWRDYEIVDGRVKGPADSLMSNMLGLGFIITAYGEDGREYFIFARRGNNLAVEGGTIGILGGTPEWIDADINVNIKKEMRDELLLNNDEFDVKGCHFAEDYTRAPDIFAHINITGNKTPLTIQTIAQRCYGNPGVMKEHDRIYAVPVEPEAIRRIAEGRASFDINPSTIVAAHFYHGGR
ncbi:MAG: hypothetical protein NT001_07190 [Candidatus Woesearchaeota archaeon]|nr:hypothetical protein [Candidatus Woesearchaeota archaeon]